MKVFKLIAIITHEIIQAENSRAPKWFEWLVLWIPYCIVYEIVSVYFFIRWCQRG